MLEEKKEDMIGVWPRGYIISESLVHTSLLPKTGFSWLTVMDVGRRGSAAHRLAHPLQPPHPNRASCSNSRRLQAES
jgi:hypothetical protein